MDDEIRRILEKQPMLQAVTLPAGSYAGRSYVVFGRTQTVAVDLSSVAADPDLRLNARYHRRGAGRDPFAASAGWRKVRLGDAVDGSDKLERLLKSADFDIYVSDRSPQVRFTGKNYVLPRVGQEGVGGIGLPPGVEEGAHRGLRFGAECRAGLAARYEAGKRRPNDRWSPTGFD